MSFSQQTWLNLPVDRAPCFLEETEVIKFLGGKIQIFSSWADSPQEFMSSTITVKFKNRKQSIAFFKSFGGCKNIVAALEAAEEREKSAQQGAQPEHLPGVPGDDTLPVKVADNQSNQAGSVSG